MAEPEKKDAPAFITFINAHGAINTVPAALYRDEYRNSGRRLSKAEIEKLQSFGADVAEQRKLRTEGETDEIRNKAARDLQRCVTAERKFRESLLADD